MSSLLSSTLWSKSGSGFNTICLHLFLFHYQSIVIQVDDDETGSSEPPVEAGDGDDDNGNQVEQNDDDVHGHNDDDDDNQPDDNHHKGGKKEVSPEVRGDEVLGKKDEEGDDEDGEY